MISLARCLTPSEARRVWEAQDRPSARSVARALTQSGRPVHFTTIARWKRERWRAVPDREHPLEAAMRAVDLTAPVLTGVATTKAEDLVRDCVRDCADVNDLAGLSQEERLNRAIDEVSKAAGALAKQISCEADRLVKRHPAGVGDLLLALGKCMYIAINSRNQLDLIRRNGRSEQASSDNPFVRHPRL